MSNKNTYKDYGYTEEELCRIDCTVTLADFDTSHPNPRRIDYVAGDINRYLTRKLKSLGRMMENKSIWNKD